MISIKSAYKSFGSLCIFEKLNLEINTPGLYVLKGESGSGKSTLLNLLAGYDKFDNGYVKINSNIATIFQNYELIEELNVLENILLLKSSLNNEDQKIVRALELEDLFEYYPSELSGGQKQRVGIARALLLNPNIILCDEPTESLDIDNKYVVMNLLKELSKKRIVLVATHDEKMIEEYVDCIYKICNKQLTKEIKNSIFNELINTETTAYSKEQVKSLIHKIIGNKTKKTSLIIVLVMLLVQQLFIYCQSMFYIPETKKVVNADYLYIDALRYEFNPTIIKKTNEDIEPILPIYSIKIDNNFESFEIYPYEENNLELLGNKPNKYGVVINQNVADYLKSWKDKTITIQYSFSTVEDSITFNISGVINEPDSTRYTIYYDLESILKEFDNQYLNVVIDNTQKEMSYREYLKKYGGQYKTNIRFEDSNLYYEYVENDIDLEVLNPLFDQRQNMIEESILFKIMFYGFDILLFTGLIMFTLIYIIKDTDKYIGTCAILASSQIKICDITEIYFYIKINYFVKYLLITEILLVIINVLLGNIYSLSSNDFIALSIFLLFVGLVFYISLLLCMRKLRYDRISNILKDDKDK